MAGADDDRQALRMRRYLMAAGTSLMVIVLLYLAYLLDGLEWDGFVQGAGLILFWVALFYAAFKTNFNLRFRDASLTLGQLGSSIVTMVYVMYFADRGRAALLVVFLVSIHTPMNGVIGMTTLLLDGKLSDRQREYVEVIRSSGDGLLTIINDIIDFSKIEAGKLDLDMQPFDPQACVEDALGLVAPQAFAKGLHLTYQLDPPLPKAIVSDSTRVSNGCSSRSARSTLRPRASTAARVLASRSAAASRSCSAGDLGRERAGQGQPFHIHDPGAGGYSGVAG